MADELHLQVWIHEYREIMMKRWTTTMIVLMLIVISLGAQTFSAEKITVEGSKLTNLYRIDEGVYRSEQPTSVDFKALESWEIVEILNLRNWHSDDDEAAATKLKLHRVRMNAHDMEKEKLVEALRIINLRTGPILIHCKHGSDRTGVVCALYRIVFQGVSKADAIKEMRNGGFGFHEIYRNIVRTLENLDVNELRQAVLEK